MQLKEEQVAPDTKSNFLGTLEALVQKKPKTVWEFVSENEKPLSVLGVIVALLGLVQGTENKRIAAALSVTLLIASVALAKSILDKEKTTVKTVGCKIFVASLEVSFIVSITYLSKGFIHEISRMVPVIAGMFMVAHIREIAGVSIEKNGMTSKTKLVLLCDVVLYLMVISLLMYNVSVFATK